MIPTRRIADIGISAHRGASIERPENTLAAFRLAIDHGAEGIELDVALSADGVPVIMHDNSVERTTNGTGEVAGLTAAQLHALDAGHGEGVPTLHEVLELAAGLVEVNIEIKSADAAPAVAEVLARHPNLDWFASGGQWGALEALKQLIPAARIFPLTTGVGDWQALRVHAIASGYSLDLIDREVARFSDLGRTLDDALEFAERVGAAGLSIWEDRLEAQHIDRVHAANLEAWVWTTNDPDRAEQLMRMGVDGICTDDPAGILARRARVAESA